MHIALCEVYLIYNIVFQVYNMIIHYFIESIQMANRGA